MKKKLKKSKKKKIIGIILLCIVAASGTVIFVKVRKNNKKPEISTTVQSAEAELGTITSSIIGTGNLEADGVANVVISSDLVIDTVYVSEGTEVSKGDVLATVEPTSVLVAIDNLTEELADIDEEIEDAKDETIDDEIEAGVSGTVTKIFAAEDMDVTDCMAENGALMIITMDDGTELKVYGTEGTIASLEVEEGEEVDAGDELITLSDLTETSEYLNLVAERKDKEEILAELFTIKKTNSITAPYDGVINSINVSGNMPSGGSAPGGNMGGGNKNK